MARDFGHLRKFESDGTHITNWNLTLDAGLTSSDSFSLAVGADEAVYIAVGNEVIKGVLQAQAYILDSIWGTQGAEVSQFEGATDIALGPNGDVYVTDRGNNRIHRYTSEGEFKSVRKGSGASSGGEFYRPTGIAVDSTGTAFEVDANFGGDPRLQVFTWDGVATGVPTGSGDPIEPPNIRGEDVILYPPGVSSGLNGVQILYELRRPASNVVLRIYDVQGRLIRGLHALQGTTGVHSVRWDELNHHGQRVASGIYFLQLQAGPIRRAAKLAIVR